MTCEFDMLPQLSELMSQRMANTSLSRINGHEKGIDVRDGVLLIDRLGKLSVDFLVEKLHAENSVSNKRLYLEYINDLSPIFYDAIDEEIRSNKPLKELIITECLNVPIDDITHASESHDDFLPDYKMVFLASYIAEEADIVQPGAWLESGNEPSAETDEALSRIDAFARSIGNLLQQTRWEIDDIGTASSYAALLHFLYIAGRVSFQEYISCISPILTNRKAPLRSQITAYNYPLWALRNNLHRIGKGLGIPPMIEASFRGEKFEYSHEGTGGQIMHCQPVISFTAPGSSLLYQLFVGHYDGYEWAARYYISVFNRSESEELNRGTVIAFSEVMVDFHTFLHSLFECEYTADDLQEYWNHGRKVGLYDYARRDYGIANLDADDYEHGYYECLKARDITNPLSSDSLVSVLENSAKAEDIQLFLCAMKSKADLEIDGPSETESIIQRPSYGRFARNTEEGAFMVDRLLVRIDKRIAELEKEEQGSI